MDTGSDWPTTSLGLVAAVRDGARPEAWERFIDGYRRVLLRFCEKRQVQADDAEDIVQQVLLDVSRQIGRFEYAPERGRFRSWLATIALRAIGKHRKRRGRTLIQNSFVLAAIRADHDSSIADLNDAVLETALDAIRTDFEPDVWLAFERTWLRDEKPQSVATALDKRPAWVYKAKFNVLQRLKVEVERLLPDIPSLQRP